MDSHFTLDSAHGGASDANHWNGAATGTYHGPLADLNLGGHLYDNGGHIGGGLSGGIIGHPTTNFDVGIGGFANSGGHSSGGLVTGTFRW